MDAFVFVIKIMVALVLLFAMIICMAISNGILSGLAMDTERAKSGKIMGSWQASYVIREYKRLNPGGRKHLQAYLASGIGFACMLAFVGWLFVFAK